MVRFCGEELVVATVISPWLPVNLIAFFNRFQMICWNLAASPVMK